ncbi:MAG: TonB-dependent receptor [Bryobacterales bacterium]|nr:TonB-dependent receptor [Bryobacterales bacterium]
MNSSKLALLLTLCLPALSVAQTVAGQVSGLVVDASGAAVPGVVVTVTDLERAVTFTGTSTDTGFYVVSPVPSGRYRVSTEKQGFRSFLLEPLPIATQQKATVNITLEVGSVSESVTVAGSAQLIETSTATLSGVVENKRIIDLPLNGRNVFALAALTPGVFGWRPASGTGGIGEGFESIGRFTVNGGRDSSNAIMMDGVPVTVNANTNNMNANTAVPSVEGVEEFRIQTNSYTAEYGRSGGGILTIATKSGTNELHGSFFEFLRNSKMDANSWFGNAAGRPLGSFKRNEFGASAGGPLWIPKVYDGRNKSFFFFAYEGRRQRSASLGQFTLPTDDQQAGDFSRTLNAQGALRVIYDPATTTPDPSRPGEFRRTAFPGNRIPTNRMDPVAVASQKYYTVKPNAPGLPFTGLQNFILQSTSKSDVNRSTLKFDHQLTSKQRMFARYTIFDAASSQPEWWPGPGCPDGGCFSNAERQQNGAFDYSNTLSPTSLLNLRWGFARSILNRGSWHQGFRPSSLGMSANVEQGADLLVFPQYGIEDVTPPGLQHHWNFRSANMSHTFVGTYSKVLSSHNLKTGTEFRSNLINHMQAPWQLIFNFNRGMTAGPDPRVVNTVAGVGYASFLLGTGAGGNVVNGIRPALESKSFGVYLQDDWRVSRKLTVNLGVRWDFETGVTERFNRFGVFDPFVSSPLNEKVRGYDLRGGWTFPDAGLGRRGLKTPEWNKIAPRIGLAYQMRQKTVIRTGYGVFYTMAPYGANHYGTAPFSASTPWLNSLDGVTPYRYLANPFPDGVLQPEGARGGLLSANGLGVGSPIPSMMTTPYNQQWNFTISQEMGKSIAMELGYAGNKGTKLPISWQMNQLATDQVRQGVLDLVDNPFFGSVPVGALSQPRVQRGQLMRPYAQYPGVSFAGASWGNSNFHALQARFEKRFSNQSSAIVAYTFSKLISDGGDNAWASAGPRDNNCRACERSLSPYDQTHRLVASFTYELPFGKGKTYGSNWNNVLNGVLGQWQVNGIGSLNSGITQQFNVPANTSNSFGGGQRPDSTGKEAKLDNPTIAQWFDTTAFAIPAQYTFGNVGRIHPSIRSDRIESLDLSVFKNFRIKERVSVQFRGEWFNALNHPIFGDPNTTVGNVNFGRVTGTANGPRQTQLALKFLF